MTTLSQQFASSSRREDIFRVALICVLVLLIGLMLPVPLGTPLAAIALGVTPFLVIFAVRHPFILCLGFVTFSFFRLHEAFPALNPFRIPQLLAIPTLLVLAWHFLGTRTLKPFVTRELQVFIVFFILVSVGVPFATDRPTAMAYWTATYVKIGVMTFAIAWLTREENDFKLAMRIMIAAGVTVSMVALSNKANGIGLVEGTRVTIGRDIRSVLGDPNDLSLVLTFPLSFAVAVATRPANLLDRLIGTISVVIIVMAVIATQSRGGLLGIIAVFGTVGWRMVKNKTILLAIGGVGLLALYAFAGISGRSSGGAAEDGIDESAMGRIHAWGAAVRMASSRPLTGVGLDNFVPNYFFYSDHWDGLNHAVHSTWFGVLGETGLPGLVVFVIMILAVVTSLRRSMFRLEQAKAPVTYHAVGLGLFSGVAGFLASATFLTQGFTWPIYILVALSAALSRIANQLGDLQIKQVRDLSEK